MNTTVVASSPAFPTAAARVAGTQHQHTRPRRDSRKRAARVGATAVLAAVLFGSSACAANIAETSGDGHTPPILTTTAQVTDFTEHIVDGTLTVKQLLPVGGSAHGFEATPADLIALGEANVLVTNGFGLEGFLDKAIAASGFRGTVIEAGAGLPHAGETAEEHAAHDEHAGETAEEHAAHDEHAGETAEEHAGHDHGGVDPHIWTSPVNAAHMVATIAAGLGEHYPEHATRFTEHATAYQAQLNELDQWIRANVDTVPAERRLVVSGHNAMHYFLEEYDITFVGAVVPSFEDNAEASAGEIDALVTEINRLGVRAIFAEQSMNPKSAAALAESTGVRVFAGPDALYTDSLGEPGTPSGTYLGATAHNLRMLMKSWDAEVLPAPAGLAGLIG